MKSIWIPVIMLGLLSGCAIIDTSSLETAKPLTSGKVDALVYCAMGTELSSAVIVEQLNNSNVSSHDDDSSPDGAWINGIKANVGILPGTDICARVYSPLSSPSWGCKLGLKQQLYHSGDKYLSFLPSFTYIRGSDGAFSLGESLNDDKGFTCSATGFEGQLLFSGNSSAKDTYTFAVRMNYHSYRETYLGTPYGPVDVIHGAISTNLKSKMRWLYIMPEIGIGIFPVVNGKTYIVGPFLSFGVGYQ